MSTPSTPSAPQPTPLTLRLGDLRVMCDRSPNDPKDMHWPIFWPDGGCPAHVFRLEDARLIVQAVNERAELLAALEGLVSDCEKWCAAVERDSSWDGWDSHYKAMKYGRRGEPSGLGLAREALLKAKEGKV